MRSLPSVVVVAAVLGTALTPAAANSDSYAVHIVISRLDGSLSADAALMTTADEVETPVGTLRVHGRPAICWSIASDCGIVPSGEPLHVSFDVTRNGMPAPGAFVGGAAFWEPSDEDDFFFLETDENGHAEGVLAPGPSTAAVLRFSTTLPDFVVRDFFWGVLPSAAVSALP